MTLFMVQPPARQRRLRRVFSASAFSTWKAASSKTAWSEAATASCRGVSGSSGRRAGPRSASSSGVKTGPMVGPPSSQVTLAPPVWWRK